MVWVLMATALTTFGLGVSATHLFRHWAINQAKKEGDSIIQDAKSEMEVVLLEIQDRTIELEQEIFGPYQEELTCYQNIIEEKEEKLQEALDDFQQNQKQWEQAQSERLQNVVRLENRIQEIKKRISELKQESESHLQKLKDLLAQKTSTDLVQLEKQLVSKEIEEWEGRIQKKERELEERYRLQSEWLAKKILARALNRFHRPYCGERGIPYVTFEEEEWPKIEKVFLHSQPGPIDWVSDICGCEIEIQKERGLFYVAGYDPVRREFARRLLERLKRESSPLSREVVESIGEKVKKELFQNIRRDGDLIVKELGLGPMHPEIKKMMGCLRYRYSFTQNQYFHCAEVGWLAGLLAEELGGVPLLIARRSGMLHDLGKSMDHEFEGGHAVIGADFIATRGESPEVVHAVRAHHYDVPPDSPLDFLVIAADAISGGRPGARRSTEVAYSQKAHEIESLARSLPGVRDCYLLSGGRECRVILDGTTTTDRDAVQTAEILARRIEETCQYPGQIRVVAVRNTIVTETKSPQKK